MTALQSADLGAAMLAAVRANAAVARAGRGDSVDFNAYWRGGERPKVRLWPALGAWRDIRTGEGGGAIAFAAKHGLSLPDFLRRYAQAQCQPCNLAPSAPARSEGAWKSGEAYRTWEALVTEFLAPCGACGACVDGVGSECRPDNPARRWLSEQRGFPSQARIETGVATATTANLAVWPESAQAWVARALRARGPALVAPLRSARTNIVGGLVLRFLNPPAGVSKCLLLPGTRTADEDGSPRGYGWAGAIRGARTVILCEGLVDTLAAQALTLAMDRVVVAGAFCVAALNPESGSWGRFLAAEVEGDVIVVPHLDGGSQRARGAGQDACAALVSYLARRGRSARPFQWTPLLRQAPRDVHGIGDLADAVKIYRDSGTDWAQTQRLFMAGLGRRP